MRSRFLLSLWWRLVSQCGRIAQTGCSRRDARGLRSVLTAATASRTSRSKLTSRACSLARRRAKVRRPRSKRWLSPFARMPSSIATATTRTASMCATRRTARWCGIATTATERAANGDGGTGARPQRRARVRVLLRLLRRSHGSAVSGLAGLEDPPYLPVAARRCLRGSAGVGGGYQRRRSDEVFQSGGLPRRTAARDEHRLAQRVRPRVEAARRRVHPDTISGQDLRVVVGRTLGWLAREERGVRDATPARNGDVYHFEGHGYGHGVGMCVIGSVNLAARGQTAAQILNRYYPGLDIVPFGAAPVVVARLAPVAARRSRGRSPPASK